MTEEQKKMFFAFGAGVVASAGAAGLAYAIVTHRRKSGNMVSSMPIPKELLMRPCESGVCFGGAPPGKCEKTGKHCSRYCGKPAGADGNILVLGGPGSGKTTGVVYPTFETWRGSMVALDCKGGMEGVWKAVHQNSGKKLFVFAPYRKHGGPCAYDPFAIMRQDPDHVVDHAWDLAESIIPIMLSEREPVWKKMAQNALAGAFLYYYDAGKHFSEAIQAINGLSVPEIEDLIRKSSNKRAQGFVSKLHGASGKTMASIGIEMNELPRLTMNQELMDALTPAPDCPLLDWGRFNTQREALDVILDIPGNRLKLYSPLIRFMITQLVKTLSLRREKVYSKHDLPSLLLMLDEFPQLGNLCAVVDALATLRSKGVTILLCTQSLAYLEAIYGKEVTRTMLETCPYKVIFNAADTESQAYLSALIGNTDVTSCSVSFNPKPGITVGKQRKPLICPEKLTYLQNPVVVSPFGVCEVRKSCLYPPDIEPPPNKEHISEQAETAGGSQSEESLYHKDNFSKKEDSTESTEALAMEAVLDRICAYCETPRSAKEIMSYINVTGRTHFMKKYINPLLEQGRLKRTHPDNSTSPKQMYRRVEEETGLANSPNSTCAHLSITKRKAPEGEEHDDN